MGNHGSDQTGRGFTMAEHEEMQADFIRKKEGLDGLTKREYFAGMAMQGLAASDTIQVWLRDNTKPGSNEGTRKLVISAVALADALIEELKS